MAVVVKFTGDATQLQSESAKAEKAISGVGNAADDAGKKSGGFASALKGASTVAGGFVLGSAITKAPGFLIDAAKAAAEDEQATARLDQALRNTSGSFDDNKAKIDARIDAGAKLAFGDDDVRDSFEQLLVATDDTDEALRRQAIAMDLARGTGMSLTQASKLLGKVNEENVDQFKKLGIEIESGATEEEALAAVQAKFAGQADTYASSSAAQFEKFHQQMGELQETIGTAVLPVLSALGTILIENVVPAMSTVAEEVAPKIAAVLVPAIDGLSVAFQNAAPYLQAVFGFMADHQEILIALGVGLAAIVVPAIIALGISAAASAIGMIALAAPFIAIALIVGGISLAIIELVRHWDDITAKYPIVGQISDALKEKFDAFIAFIRDPFLPAVQSIYDTISRVVGDVVAFVQTHWREVWETIEPVLKIIGDGVALYFGIVQTTVETVINAVRDIINIVMGLLTGDWDRAWNGLKDLVNDVWEGIKSIAGDAIHFIETELVPLMLKAATALGGAIQDGIVAGIKGTVGVIGDLTDRIWDAIKSLINSGIQSINDLIPDSIGFSVLGHGVSVSLPANPIPALAAGGVTTGPTVAMIGEAGPEAVIPLSSWEEQWAAVTDPLIQIRDLIAFLATDSASPLIQLATGLVPASADGVPVKVVGGEIGTAATPAGTGETAPPTPAAPPTPTNPALNGSVSGASFDDGSGSLSGAFGNLGGKIDRVHEDTEFMHYAMLDEGNLVSPIRSVWQELILMREDMNIALGPYGGVLTKFEGLNSYLGGKLDTMIGLLGGIAQGLGIDNIIDRTDRRRNEAWTPGVAAG